MLPNRSARLVKMSSSLSSLAVLSIDVGRKNLGLCALRPGACSRGTGDRIARWAVTACEPTAAGIARALAALPWTREECAEVVIERQPNRNATMSRLQHYLEMYFALHDKPVTVLDAKHKLAFAASTPWWPSATADEAAGWTYHLRKKLSVQTAQAFLLDTDQESSLRDVFRVATKKDDLADSLLQCMAFCHHVRRPADRRGEAKPPAEPALVRPRKPSVAQVEAARSSKRPLCKSHVAYFIRSCATVDEARSLVAAADALLAKSIEKHFGGVDTPEFKIAFGFAAEK